jgi:DNA-binding response OmpR family regulator
MEAARISTARNGREAVDLFDQTGPALVVLDIGLPGMSGLEVLRYIRFRSATTEVLVFTNSGSIEMETQCRALGANHFLDKAHDITLLVDLLRALGGTPTPTELLATV